MYRKLLNSYHLFFAFAGAVWYGRPGRKLVVVGVTGTKGKSTVLELIRAMLLADHRRPALLSTVHRIIADETGANPYGNTMPGRGRLQHFLRDAAAAGATHALIEVSSEGIRQHRHRFIDWDVAVFNNLSPEHVESHGSFEAYRGAKLDFFRSLASSAKRVRRFAVNADDANVRHFEDVARSVPGHAVTRFSPADLSAAVRSAAEANVWLAAPFNMQNVAAAAAVAEALGAPEAAIVAALQSFRGLAGRFERVQTEPFQVIVDYAHTPDSFLAIYGAVRSLLAPGTRLIGVFGSAAGGRDAWKRPVMGKIAAEACDVVVLTNEDPFDEVPERILDAIARGFLDASPRRLREDQTFRILDRRMAIRKAFHLARPGDAVVLTGKGSETVIRIANGETVPWNERQVAEEELAAMKK
ncbi:MAG: UDP-N-acetylmuramyl-tripeptide synthetase [bacterium]|nr:UDP-N-acetylmuramyl-tripeptide synthetase [bacterium]